MFATGVEIHFVLFEVLLLLERAFSVHSRTLFSIGYLQPEHSAPSINPIQMAAEPPLGEAVHGGILQGGEFGFAPRSSHRLGRVVCKCLLHFFCNTLEVGPALLGILLHLRRLRSEVLCKVRARDRSSGSCRATQVE